MDLAVVGQEYFSLGLKNKDGKIEVGHGRGHAGFIVAIQSRIAGGELGSEITRDCKDGMTSPFLAIRAIPGQSWASARLSWPGPMMQPSRNCHSFPARSPCHDPFHHSSSRMIRWRWESLRVLGSHRRPTAVRQVLSRPFTALILPLSDEFSLRPTALVFRWSSSTASVIGPARIGKETSSLLATTDYFLDSKRVLRVLRERPCGGPSAIDSLSRPYQPREERHVAT